MDQLKIALRNWIYYMIWIMCSSFNFIRISLDLFVNNDHFVTSSSWRLFDNWSHSDIPWTRCSNHFILSQQYIEWLLIEFWSDKKEILLSKSLSNFNFEWIQIFQLINSTFSQFLADLTSFQNSSCLRFIPYIWNLA